jgi:hypothetical protein
MNPGYVIPPQERARMGPVMANAIEAYYAGSPRALFPVLCGHHPGRSHTIGTMHATPGGYLLQAYELKTFSLRPTPQGSPYFFYWPFSEIAKELENDETLSLYCGRCSNPLVTKVWGHSTRFLLQAAQNPKMKLVGIRDGKPIGVLKRVTR